MKRRAFPPRALCSAVSSFTIGACSVPAPPPSDSWLDFGPDRAEIGYGEAFAIDVAAANAAARRGEIRWTQIDGPPLRGLSVSDRGFHFEARLPALGDLFSGPPFRGVVPISPRTRGQVTLEGEWHAAHGPALRRRITIAAATRARGLPNVPLGQRVHLGGGPWHLTERPLGSTAYIEPRGGIDTLLPDLPGPYRLTADGADDVHLTAGRYDETPLDCGRSGCHAEIATAAQASPMTRAFERLVAARAGNVACAVSCHTTGEPHTRDGGFHEAAEELGWHGELDRVRDTKELPRQLRRLGGVGCTACHGPGNLPDEGARWSILRADVCSYCHDAPPRYGHVVAWRASTMSSADRDPETRSSTRCARCHTTWGFLSRERGRGGGNGAQIDGVERRPPRDATLGIACAACHAVHDPERGEPTRALLRSTTLPRWFDAIAEAARTRSGVCLACHAPDPSSGLPEASAALLWAGRGGLDPETGAEVVEPAAHTSIDGGCVGCHDAGPGGIERGVGHAFRANAERCAKCHDPVPAAPGAALRQRALELFRRLADGRDEANGDRPLHARREAPPRRATSLERAAYDVALVLEDPAAGAHNANYARHLLTIAEQAVDKAPTRRTHLGGP
ncbi:MAG TPA: hypothetical protein VJT73_11945 [Polyangiaceae bacterium]|nr:hypothetical protein [Polyangiaceae bacterium]